MAVGRGYRRVQRYPRGGREHGHRLSVYRCDGGSKDRRVRRLQVRLVRCQDLRHGWQRRSCGVDQLGGTCRRTDQNARYVRDSLAHGKQGT